MEHTVTTHRVFSRDVVLGGGGNCFCGERKCEEYPKNKRNSLLFRGEIQNLGGEISPPLKALKKTLLAGNSALTMGFYWSYTLLLDIVNSTSYAAFKYKLKSFFLN